MSENPPYRTPQEAKAWLKEQGFSIAGWSKANGFSPESVRQVLGGKNKMLYGEGRKIGKALNLQVPEIE